VRAVANFQRDTQRSDTAAGREEGAGSGRQLSASRMAGAGGGENRDNGGLLDTAEFWYAAPMPRVAPDAECAICLGALITTATSTESPAPGTSSARRSSPAPAAAAAPDDVVALRYCGHVFHLVRVTHSAWHTHAVQPGTGTELIRYYINDVLIIYSSNCYAAMHQSLRRCRILGSRFPLVSIVSAAIWGSGGGSYTAPCTARRCVGRHLRASLPPSPK
jgi:hypothetical protein